MPTVRRVLRVAFESRTYLSLAYLMLRLPLGLTYAGIVVLMFARPLLDLTTVILLFPAALAVWGTVVLERAIARNWFGAHLAPMAPVRPPDRPGANV